MGFVALGAVAMVHGIAIEPTPSEWGEGWGGDQWSLFRWSAVTHWFLQRSSGLDNL